MTETSSALYSEYGWRPVFDRPVELAPVADDTRDTLTQMAHYLRLTGQMNVTTQEAVAISEAFQLCERAHGYARIAPALKVVACVVENAIALTGTTVTLIARQRGYRNAGLLVGCLLEERIHIEPDRRRFPPCNFEPRVGSPYVEYEDCLMGVRTAERLGPLDEVSPSVTRPFGALASAFRQRLGVKGWRWLEDVAAGAVAMTKPLDAFTGAVSAEAMRTGVRLPAQWRHFIRLGL